MLNNNNFVQFFFFFFWVAIQKPPSGRAKQCGRRRGGWSDDCLHFLLLLMFFFLCICRRRRRRSPSTFFCAISICWINMRLKRCLLSVALVVVVVHTYRYRYVRTYASMWLPYVPVRFVSVAIAVSVSAAVCVCVCVEAKCSAFWLLAAFWWKHKYHNIQQNNKRSQNRSNCSWRSESQGILRLPWSLSLSLSPSLLSRSRCKRSGFLGVNELLCVCVCVKDFLCCCCISCCCFLFKRIFVCWVNWYGKWIGVWKMENGKWSHVAELYW